MKTKPKRRPRFYAMSFDEKRAERTRRVPLMMKAIRDMQYDEALSLLAVALLLVGDFGGADVARRKIT